METEPTVLELLGMITQSFSVDSEPDGEQAVSTVQVLQTDSLASTNSTSVPPRIDKTTSDKAEEATFLNIQRLVGQISDIGNVVESVGTNLQAVQNGGIMSSALQGNEIGGLFGRQMLQSVEKTDTVAEKTIISSRRNSSGISPARDLKVLDQVKLGRQDSGRSAPSLTDRSEKVFMQGTLFGNCEEIMNNKLENTLPAFLSSQHDSLDKIPDLPVEEKVKRCLPDTNRSDVSGNQEGNTADVLLNNQVAHIAYNTHHPPTYVMQKHTMEDLIVKPYMCGICGAIFGTTSKLGQHVRKSHYVQTLEGSEVDSCREDPSLNLAMRTGSKGEVVLEGEHLSEQKDVNGKKLENLEQSLPEHKSTRHKDSEVTFSSKVRQGKDESKLSSGRRTRHSSDTTTDQTDKETQKKRMKVNTESGTTFHAKNLHRQCQELDDAPQNCADGGGGSVRNSSVKIGNPDVSLTGGDQGGGSLKRGSKSGKAFKCEFCEALFTSNKYRYKHRVASHPEATFQCPGCDKSYKVTEKDKWQHHVRIHNKQPPKPKPESYHCAVCSVAFRAANAVAIHMQTFHPEAVRDDKPFCCEICGNLFRTKSALKSHQTLVHSDDKPFQCGTCGRAFKKDSYLKLHQRTHTGEKPFKCKFCNKTFPSTTGRRCHERTHTNEKPYKCSYCGISFRAKPQLVEHERVHTQERPFVCGLCGKSFASRTSYKTHEFLHTGRKPHKCGSCPRTFAQKSNLTDHYRSIHSQEKPYQCTVCDAKFTRSTSRKVHMEKKHGLKITVRQGRPPTHESDQTVDSIVATCLSLDVSSVLTPTEQATLRDTFSLVVNNQSY